MKKFIKAISALHYHTAVGAHLVEPQTTVALDEDLADAFIASGDAVGVATPVVAEPLPVAADPTETSSAVELVVRVGPDFPHLPGPKLGKRGR